MVVNYSSVIDKRTLGVARSKLRVYLKNFEDEPLDHKLGPPDISFSPSHHGIPNHLVDKFWELMLKENIVTRHPYGGFMHLRFAKSNIPAISDVKKGVLDIIGGENV